MTGAAETAVIYAIRTVMRGGGENSSISMKVPKAVGEDILTYP